MERHFGYRAGHLDAGESIPAAQAKREVALARETSSEHRVPIVLLAMGVLNMLACFLVELIGRPQVGAFDLFVAAASLLATLSCLHRCISGPAATRTLWGLIAAGLFLWTIGQVEFAGAGAIPESARMVVSKGDFFFFVYGIPILIAMSCANEGDRPKASLWPDAVIAALAAALAYMELFSVLPEWGRLTPMSSVDLRNVYGIQNGVLACAGTVRLLASPPGEKRSIYSALSAFLWIHALVAIISSSSKFGRGAEAAFHDVVWQAPFLMLLTALAFWPEVEGTKTRVPVGASTSEFLVDNLSPLSLTIGVIILASEIGREHFGFKVFSISAAVLLFGLRTIIRQRNYERTHVEAARSQKVLIEKNAELNQQALRDGLTGAYNRRHFDQMLSEEWKRAYRGKQCLSLIMVDVDHFKALNDRYGHPTGDAVLRAIVRSLTAALRRPGDLLARYGGEEFAIILPGVDLQGAVLVAEQMRGLVEQRRIPNEDSPAGGFVTLSAGAVCVHPTDDGSPDEMLERVDAVLYRAKSQGRNRVCV